MDLPLDAEVRCVDGECGKSSTIVLNPVTGEVTHLVVRSKGVVHEEFMVPLDLVTSTEKHHIQLRCTRHELALFEPFTSGVFYGPGDAGYREGARGVSWPYARPEDQYIEAFASAYSETEQVPHGELAIHRGSHVHATDGRIGTVDEFLINPTNNHITHLVLREGHLWGKRDVTVGLSAIDRIEEDRVYLNLDKATVKDLPGIPIKR